MKKSKKKVLSKSPQPATNAIDVQNNTALFGQCIGFQERKGQQFNSFFLLFYA